MERATIKRYRRNWQEEVDSAAQYHAMADAERETKLAAVYRSLARTEEAHVSFWEDQLRKAGDRTGPRRPSWRSRVLIALARLLGPRSVLSTIATNETIGRNHYLQQPESRLTRMAAQERWHAQVLKQAMRCSPEGIEGGFLGRLEGRHHAVGGNSLRAAVLGANDGLCSNLALVMGVAGASANARTLLVTGIAGLIAGAFSMALGEYISVRSSRELSERELRVEREELLADPEGEGQELRLIYEAKGFKPKEAQSMVDHLLSDRKLALDALSREELGIDPNESPSSPWIAAIASFTLFSLGAAIPVLPFILLSGNTAIAASLALSTLALFGIGAAITIFTGRPVWISGMRQLSLGLCAAGITFGIGRLVGAAV